MNESEALEFAKSTDWARWVKEEPIRKMLSDIRSHIDAKSSQERAAAPPAATAEDNKIKLVVVGDGSVGKTCMLVVFSTRVFPEEYVPTVFDNYTAMTKIGTRDVSLHLWDTAGQDEYDRLRPLSYPGTDVVLMCLNTISQASYESVSEKWSPEIKHYLPNVPVILVGLKTDLREAKTVDPHTLKFEPVTTEMGHQLAAAIKARKYMEVSARENKGIDEVFTEAVSIVWRIRHPEDVVPRGSSADAPADTSSAQRGLPARLVVEEDPSSEGVSSEGAPAETKKGHRERKPHKKACVLL